MKNSNLINPIIIAVADSVENQNSANTPIRAFTPCSSIYNTLFPFSTQTIQSFPIHYIMQNKNCFRSKFYGMNGMDHLNNENVQRKIKTTLLSLYLFHTIFHFNNCEFPNLRTHATQLFPLLKGRSFHLLFIFK